MKKTILAASLGFCAIAAISLSSQAQVPPEFWFSPNTVTYIDSVGAKTVKIPATFWANSLYQSQINFVGSKGISSNPSELYVGGGKFSESFNITVIVNLDSEPTCLDDPQGLSVPGDSSVFATLFVEGYKYDPKIIGRVSLYYGDTLNFGSVPVGDSIEGSVYVSIDTLGSIYRTLQPLNVQVPFSPPDSVVPSFGGCSVMVGNEFFYFQPTEAKQYIDTAYLYDPIRKDSTMLILIGDGVAAGVAENTVAEPAMQVYPNPCDQFANIVLPSEGLEQVEIRNALGAVVQSYRNVNFDLTIDVSSLPDGIYFIEARVGDSVITKKLVVIH